MKRALVLFAVLALAVTACGGDDDAVAPPGDETTAPGDDTTDDTADGDGAEAGTLTGVLGGDAQLEGGCIWIEPTGGPDAELGDRIQPILPDGFRVEFEPDLRIIGPDGAVVAERGDEVVVEGQPADEMVSICQVGPLYQVDEFLGTAGS